MEAVKVKHTPGPWVMRHNWSGSYEIDIDTGKRIAHVDIVIPSTSTVSEHIEQGNEIAANAQLIAAAPDLLEAAKFNKKGFDKFLAEANLDTSFLSAESIQWLNEFSIINDKAIAKAEGRTA